MYGNEAEGRAIEALVASAEGMLQSVDDLTRVARIGALIPPATLSGRLRPVLDQIVGRQRADGGWSSVEESLWCTAVLGRISDLVEPAADGLAWLGSQRHVDGGLPRSPREQQNFVLSALAVSAVPGLAREADLGWIARSWERDMGQDVRLTYKGGLYLLSSGGVAGDLTERTIEYLASEQNTDGGFGPWKGHPIGSDAWSTGLCVLGLSTMATQVVRPIVVGAVDWLLREQLGAGHWRCHFIDEGSAYAYWGLSEGLNLIRSG